jgi:hypothetical protein
MEEKIRHHYVPATYLKRFGFEKYKDQFYLHRIPKNSITEAEINCSNVKKICVISNLYTLPGANAQERMLVEDFYSDTYERHYSKVYKKLIDENVTDISDEDRRVIIGMIVSLFYRNPFWNK